MSAPSNTVDFSRLKDPSFDTVTWINDLFRAQPGKAPGELDAYATSIVMKLQLYIQELEKHVEDLMQGVIASVPRVIRDAEALRHEAMMLHNQMSQIRGEVETLCGETRESMKLLVKLDAQHDKISAIIKCIQQADSWSTLTMQIEDCFLSEDIDAISEKLKALNACLPALTNTPEYETRKTFLDNLKNRSEALLSPKVLQAFKTHDEASFKKFKAIFAQIGREDSLYKFYYQSHKIEFQKKWADICGEGYESATDQLTMVFSELQSLAEKEQSFVKGLKSGDGNEEQKGKEALCEMITSCILALEPSLTTVIQSYIDTVSPKDILSNVSEIHAVEKTFVENIEHCSNSESVRLQAAVYASLVPNLLKSTTMCYNQLCPTIESFTWGNRDLHRAISIFEDSRSVVERAVQHSIVTCKDISQDLAILSFCEAIDKFYVYYISKLNVMVDSISNKLGFNEKAMDSGEARKPTKTLEDWSLFQNAAQLTQMINRISSDINMINSEVVENHLLTNFTAFMQVYHSDHYAPFNYLKMWNNTEWKKLCDTVSAAKTKKDSVNLFPKAEKEVAKLLGKSQKLTIDTVLEYVKQQLQVMLGLKDWGNASPKDSAINKDLPTFSLSPLEYITHIGQYIMSLPGQLELLETDPQILEAFSTTAIPTQSALHLSEDNICEFWLGHIIEEVMKLYLETSWKISYLSDEGCRQLSADIKYFQNVLDDLELKLSGSLAAYLQLLESPFNEISKMQSSVPTAVYTAVKAQRR